jgi:DNA-binding transcriptional LysR family regulator
MEHDLIRQIDLRSLRYFSVLAEELHFGRAAARLHMSQPPLSLAIRQLEERLGVSLFSRSHHRVELTEAGRMLQQQALLVFAQFERAVDRTRQTGRGLMGRLEIGMISSALVGVIPRTLRVFRDRYPEVIWRLHEMTPDLQLEGLREGRIDICFFRMPREQPGLENQVVLRETLMVALPLHHTLVAHSRLALADLAGQPFILFGRERSRFAEYLFQCCVQAGFTPEIRQQVIEVQTLLSLVGAGLGVALLPESMRHIAPGNVVFKRLVPALPKVPLYAIYRDEDPSPSLRLFLDVVHEQVADLESRRERALQVSHRRRRGMAAGPE